MIATGKLQEAETFGGSGTFADEINALHNEILDLGKTALERAIRIGDLLVANRNSVRHGDWLKWLKKNVIFDRTTAFRYMRLFERRDELNVAGVQHLAEAYALLAEKIDRDAARANGEQAAAVASDSDSKPIDAEPTQKQKSVEGKILTVLGDDEEAIWRRELLDRAQKATCGAAYEDTWAKYTFDAELIDAATEAATAWQNLVTFLNRFPF